MSESRPNDAQGGAPSLSVKAQYVKDLSFENPNAPQSFQETGAPPNFDVDVNVNARSLGASNYEVELAVAARARRGDMVAFVVEATYAGVFEIRNVPPEQVELIMLVECPRILFPYARQIISDATRNGNYPPLMLEPIDFFAVYQRDKMVRAGAAGPQMADA